jgi:hypothetical protein
LTTSAEVHFAKSCFSEHFAQRSVPSSSTLFYFPASADIAVRTSARTKHVVMSFFIFFPPCQDDGSAARRVGRAGGVDPRMESKSARPTIQFPVTGGLARRTTVSMHHSLAYGSPGSMQTVGERSDSPLSLWERGRG